MLAAAKLELDAAKRLVNEVVAVNTYLLEKLNVSIYCAQERHMIVSLLQGALRACKDAGK